MAKVKIEVLDAVIDGHGKGEQLSVDEKSAKHFESIGYAKLIAEAKPKADEQKPKKKSK